MIRESTPEDEWTGTPATIEFLHNTFKEYLAGEQLAAENRHRMVLGKLDQEVWRRVGLFAFAAGSAEFQNALLRGVFDTIPEELPKSSRKQSQPVSEQTRARAIFALQCRGLATQCEEPVKARLNAVASQVVPPRTVADAAWLAAAGNVIVPHLKYRRRKCSVQLACARALKLIGTPEALRELTPYGAEDLIPVVQELFGVVPCTASGIHSLTISRRHLRGLTGIESLAGLESVAVRDCTGVTDLRPLATLPKLHNLEIMRTPVEDWSGLPQLSALLWLFVSDCDLVDLNPIADTGSLVSLHLFHCHRLNDLAPLARMPKLSRLTVWADAVTDFTPLVGIRALHTLHIRSTSLSDVSSLSGMPTVREVSLFLTPVANLTPLGSLKNLQKLDLSFTRAGDLQPLQQLDSLEELDLSHTPVTDLSPLLHLPRLRVLTLAGVGADTRCLSGEHQPSYHALTASAT
jgi:hypothetical protein